MALRATPTLAICLTAGIAAGIALARPGDTPTPAAVVEAALPAATTPVVDTPAGNPDSPYLVDAPTEQTPRPVEPDPVEPVVASTVDITIEGFAFVGPTTASPASPVAVTNLDGAPHTLTAVDGSFDTGTLGQDETATLALPTAPGTYEFFCAIHPSMVGSIIVG